MKNLLSKINSVPISVTYSVLYSSIYGIYMCSNSNTNGGLQLMLLLEQMAMKGVGQFIPFMLALFPLPAVVISDLQPILNISTPYQLPIYIILKFYFIYDQILTEIDSKGFEGLKGFLIPGYIH